MKKDYAIIFERINLEGNENCNLRALDFVEGEEIVQKNGNKEFKISEEFKEKIRNEFGNDPFYQFINESIMSYMEEYSSLENKYVYGSPTYTKLFKKIVENDLLSDYSVEEVFEETENLKELYAELLKEYDFYQLKNGDSNLITYCKRKEPIDMYIDMNDISNDIMYQELGIDIKDSQIVDNYTFKPLPEKIDVKNIYNECQKYIIGQDEHILPILCAINDNLAAEIPEEKKNVLICGSTGVGKTAIFKRISELVGIPIVIENAPQFTQAGYVGRNIDDIFEDLLLAANNDLELAQRGIIIIDEIDKKASGKDDNVSGVGVIHSMLKLLEGGNYTYETGKGFNSELKTFNTLKTTIGFCGAFSDLSNKVNKKILGFERPISNNIAEDVFNLDSFKDYGIPEEFIGRIDLLEVLKSLTEDDLKKILTTAKLNPYTLFIKKMKKYNTEVKADDAFLDAIAKVAYQKKTGARALKYAIEYSTKLAEAQIALSPTYKKELILTPECAYDNKAYTLKRVYKNNKNAISK